MKNKVLIAKVVLLSLLLSIILPVVAVFAENGYGGGTGGYTGQGGAHWTKTSGPNFMTFRDRTFRNDLSINRIYERNFSTPLGKDKLKDLCMKSHTIWYITPDHNPGWHWSWNLNIINDLRASFVRTFSNESAEVKNYVLNHTSRNITILCSAQFEPPVKDIPTYYETRQHKKNFEEEVPIYTTVDVSRHITRDGKDPIGKDNLHNQKTQVFKTPFYQFKIDVENKKYKTTTDIEQAFEKFKNQFVRKNLMNPNKAVVDLDDRNKEGMAEGGVLNITERATTSTISASTIIYERRQVKCKAKFDGNRELPGTRTCSYGNWEEYKRDEKSAASGLSIPKMSRFWQMLTVHCNEEGFDRLVAQLGNKVWRMRKDSTGKGIYASVETVPSEKQQYYVGVGESGDVGFYDKECALECVPDASGVQASKNGASTDNVGLDNNRSDTKGGAYGNNNKQENTNRFEIFRDGKEIPLNVNVWYPKQSDGLEYDGHKAVTTTVTRWDLGTPDVSGNQAGRFMFGLQGSPKGSSIFSKDRIAAPTQKNWDSVGFKSSTTAILPGQQNKFKMSATWASEEGKPNILNFKYEYAPLMKQTFPTRVGFNGFEMAQENLQTHSVPIQGKCYASFGVDGRHLPKHEFNVNTGSGVPNTLDGRLFGPGFSVSDYSNPYNLYINTIRAVAE